LDERIIILPMADIWTFVGIGVFLICMFFLYVFAYNYIKKREFKVARWGILMNFLLRHDLNTKEVEIIHELYQSLSVQTQEEIITSTKRFHRLLSDYLIEKSNLEVEEKVIILEKLFPTSERFHEVYSLEDLITGEVCAVESSNGQSENKTEDKFMGFVVKKSINELLISIDDFNPVTITKDSAVGVYVYRPHIGGFLISGTIRQMGPDFIIFQFNGKIEQKSGHHLMAEMKAEAVFKPWPLPEPGDKSASHEIRGITYLFSDRALVFSAVNEEDIHYYLNHHDMWSIKVKLPGGYVFSCRGTISVSKNYEKMYIFRFLDASESSRNILFIDIKEHKPVNEKIG